MPTGVQLTPVNKRESPVEIGTRQRVVGIWLRADNLCICSSDSPTDRPCDPKLQNLAAGFAADQAMEGWTCHCHEKLRLGANRQMANRSMSYYFPAQLFLVTQRFSGGASEPPLPDKGGNGGK